MEKKLTVGLYQKSPHYLKVLQTRFKIYVLLIIHVQMTNNQTSPITPPPSYNYYYNYYYVKNVTVKSSAKLLHLDGECGLIRSE